MINTPGDVFRACLVANLARLFVFYFRVANWIAFNRELCIDWKVVWLGKEQWLFRTENQFRWRSILWWISFLRAELHHLVVSFFLEIINLFISEVNFLKITKSFIFVVSFLFETINSYILWWVYVRNRSFLRWIS